VRYGVAPTNFGSYADLVHIGRVRVERAFPVRSYSACILRSSGSRRQARAQSSMSLLFPLKYARERDTDSMGSVDPRLQGRDGVVYMPFAGSDIRKVVP
jgi:hypothetical protein